MAMGTMLLGGGEAFENSANRYKKKIKVEHPCEKPSESDDVLRNASLNHSYFNNGPGIVEHNTEGNPIIRDGNAPPSITASMEGVHRESFTFSSLYDVNTRPFLLVDCCRLLIRHQAIAHYMTKKEAAGLTEKPIRLTPKAPLFHTSPS